MKQKGNTQVRVQKQDVLQGRNGISNSEALHEKIFDALKTASDRTAFLMICQMIDASARNDMNTPYEKAVFAPEFLKLMRETMAEALYAVIEQSNAPKETLHLLTNFCVLMTLIGAIERGNGFVQPHVNGNLIECVSQSGSILSKLGMVMFVAKDIP